MTFDLKFMAYWLCHFLNVAIIHVTCLLLGTELSLLAAYSTISHNGPVAYKS